MSIFTEQRHQMLAIATAITCITVVGIGLSLSVPLLSLVLEARGVSGTMIGINTAMSGVATIMLAPFIPNIAARLGTRRLLISALVLGAVVFISFYYAGPFWLWFPLRFLFGVSLCVLFVLSEFWINAAAPEGSRGLVMGIYASCLSVGFAIGPTVLTIFPPSSMAPYVIGAALFLLSIIPVAWAGHLMPRIDHTPSNQVLLYLAAAPSAVLAAFIFGAVETGGMSFLPLYGLRNGYGEASAALLVSILALGNVVVQIPMGLLSDRVDRRKLLLTLGAVGFVGAAAMPFAAQHAFALFPIVAIWGGLVAGLYTVGLAHLGAQFRGSQLAGANATFVMMYSLGLLAGPPAMGLGMDIWNPHGLPVTIALLFLLYVVVVAWRLATGRSASQKATSENP